MIDKLDETRENSDYQEAKLTPGEKHILSAEEALSLDDKALYSNE